MFFNSVDFAVFFLIVFALYWILSKNKNYRNILILCASYFFYGWWDWRFLLLIAGSSCVDFIIGQLLHKTTIPKKRKQLLGISLFVNLGLLFYFKYTNFFIESFVSSFRLFGAELEIQSLSIILPVGISFYTFQTLSYTIDVYRKQITPTKDVVSFFAFVSFFPQLVAGPIERASRLLPQFYKTHTFNYDRVKSGLLLVAFGLFKKMVIADRAAVVVNQVFTSPGDYEGYQVVLASFLFAFQIYCDFSGYSDIAIGVARTMGFNLMKNFDTPYFSTSITAFWRRWHISLSTWFRDYVYIPLGGSRKGNYRTYANLFIVFLVSGLWHGAAINFVIWGAIHGIIIVFEKVTYRSKQPVYKYLGLDKNIFSNRLFFGLITFTIVCFAWIFFRAESFADAKTLIGSIFTNNYHLLFSEELYTLGLERGNMILLFGAIISLISFEIITKRVAMVPVLAKQSYIFRWSVYFAIALVLVLLGYYGTEDRSQFIYFQF